MKRDNQRGKFHRAMPEGKSFPNCKEFKSEEEAITFVKGITKREWFITNFGEIHIRFLDQGSVHGLRVHGSNNRVEMRIRKWTFKSPILLRLLAHALAPHGAAYHGAEFCAIYLYLVKKVLGDAACAMLIQRLVINKINFRPNPVMDSVEGQMVLFKLNGVLPR